MSRMCFTVMRLSFCTITLPALLTMSKQALGHHLELDALLRHVERVEREELLEDLLGGVAEGLQQDRHRHLAAAVDAEVEVVLGIELEVEPGAAVGDHAGG